MEAGKLRHRVIIEKTVQTQNASTGELSTTWSAVCTVWAKVEPLSASEFIASRAGQSEITGKITMRHRTDVDATMRVIHRGKVYNIEGVIDDNRSGLEWMTLPVSEGINTGEI